MRGLLIIICLFFVIPVTAQEKLKFGDTGKTNTSPTYTPKDKKIKKRKPLQWVKNSPNGLLIGNSCMEEVFSDMGFIYTIQRKGRIDTMNELHRFFHNMMVKLKLSFKNGPFWKFKLKKKRKECRELTGDYVG